MNILRTLLTTSMVLVLVQSCGDSGDLISSGAGQDQDTINAKGDTLEPQISEPGWQHLDLANNSRMGISSEKAYNELNLSQQKEIIVAVIDSGIDIEHEDLKEIIWKNQKEIDGEAGVDDDGNGYVDDFHGWNFLGGKDGRNIDGETLEVTRIFRRLQKRVSDGDTLTAQELELLEKTKKEVTSELESNRKSLETATANKNRVEEILKKIGVTEFTAREEIVAFESGLSDWAQLKEELLKIWDSNRRGFAGFDRSIERANTAINFYYNVDYRGREEIVQDEPGNFEDKDYGNNDVIAIDPFHGTHVAGIIGAVRNNGIGENGVAANVKIMVLRAVPNGDERDKDVALAVRYAADKGAKVINMSFGKSYSPYKKEVDAAFQYAASKGVLLVHAAGNSAKNTDFGKDNYPNYYLRDGAGVLTENRLANWIEVGASTLDPFFGLPASFSNYGHDSVHLFAPGRNITSSTPGSEYGAASGTSMASPVVAGVGALLLSEFKDLNAARAREIMLTTVHGKSGQNVKKPTSGGAGNSQIVGFGALSQTGGIVNVFNAVLKARESE